MDSLCLVDSLSGNVLGHEREDLHRRASVADHGQPAALGGFQHHKRLFRRKSLLRPSHLSEFHCLCNLSRLPDAI